MTNNRYYNDWDYEENNYYGNRNGRQWEQSYHTTGRRYGSTSYRMSGKRKRQDQGHVPFKRRAIQKKDLRRQLFLDKESDIRGSHPYPNDIHLLQNKKPKVVNSFEEKDRILDYDAKGERKEYYYRLDDDIVTVNHWGQRKLMLSEIEFLTLYLKPEEKATVLYCGAGPGNHTNDLAKLFPNVHFMLVDPLPKERWVVTETDQIEIVYGYMTNEMAKQFSPDEEIRKSMDPEAPKFHGPKDRVFLISDIRNTKHFKAKDLDEHEENIIHDNQLQKEWVDIIQPEAAMLKFRCPFYVKEKHVTEESRCYEYFDGDIYLPVWGKVETCECRLIVNRGNGLKTYDKQKFEEKMMWFNTEKRVQYYEHPYAGAIMDAGIVGMDHCYDCRSELWILNNYIQKYRAKEENKIDLLVKMVKDLSPICSQSGRMLDYIEHINLSIGKDIELK